MTEPESVTLECGRDPLAVVDRARAGRSDDHESTCPFCQAAISAAAVSREAARDVSTETVAPPPGLVPGVMRTVWTELRRPTEIPIASPNGAAFVTDLAVGSVLETALNELPNLLIHACTVGHGDGGLTVVVDAAGAYRSDLEELGRAARSLIGEVLLGQFGLTAVTADIAIVDVFDPQEAS